MAQSRRDTYFIKIIIWDLLFTQTFPIRAVKRYKENSWLRVHTAMRTVMVFFERITNKNGIHIFACIKLLKKYER